MLSIRHSDTKKASALADKAYRLLVEEKEAIDSLTEKLQEDGGKDASISLTETLNHTEKTIATAHKEILKKLSPNNYSMPIAQKSRSTNTTVYRIFFLKN